MPTDFVIPSLFDAHVHLRQGELASKLCTLSAGYCDSIVVMPNTDPPVLTKSDLLAYKASIAYDESAIKLNFTAKLTNSTTTGIIDGLKRAGAIGLKLYPQGLTTNSDDGLTYRELNEITTIYCDILFALTDNDMVLLVHGEMPGKMSLERETAFIPVIEQIVDRFPNLRVVFEHITTASAVNFVKNHHSQNLAATITLHHLFTTLDDIIGGKLQPDYFCKPIPKFSHDRLALIGAAISGLPRFFLGSDSAPHTKSAKYAGSGCAGVFSSPHLLNWLVELFDSLKQLDKLAGFASDFGRQFYRLPAANRSLHLINKTHTIPKTILNEYTPFMGGKDCNWAINPD